MSAVLVVCEVKEGKLRKPSREALSAGRKLAAATGGELLAAAFGPDAGLLADECGKLGAVRLLAVGGDGLAEYSTEPYTAALAQVIAEAKPAVVLLSGSSDGRDLAPRIAARLGAGVASDVTSLEWANDSLRARRPVYSGRAFATVEVASTPAFATCRPNAFPVEETSQGASEVVNIAPEAIESKARVTETKAPEAGELTIAEADIIVSGGRGLKEAENFSIIRDLAHAIGAAVGASRATVDAGWIDHQHQVGQTGRVVGPNLYIAAGISGAIQHLAGMSSSKHIVAINKDPDAPIFRIADLGVVGDLFTILPALTEEVKKAR
jgi:electron transfer flavoprotein alpha subunit